jgi:hypothetical protein
MAALQAFGRAVVVDNREDTTTLGELEVNMPRSTMLRPYLKDMRTSTIAELPIGAPTLLRAMAEKGRREGLDMSWRKGIPARVKAQMDGGGARGKRGRRRNGRERLRKNRQGGKGGVGERALLERPQKRFKVRGLQADRMPKKRPKPSQGYYRDDTDKQ